MSFYDLPRKTNEVFFGGKGGAAARESFRRQAEAKDAQLATTRSITGNWWDTRQRRISIHDRANCRERNGTPADFWTNVRFFLDRATVND